MAPLPQVDLTKADAENYAFAALGISSFALGMAGALAQYLLLSLRCFPSKLRPTNGELFCVMVALFLLHYIFDTILSDLVDNFIFMVIPEDVAVLYATHRGTHFKLQSAFALGPGTLLLAEVSISWLIFLSLVYILDTVIPLLLNLIWQPYIVYFTLLRRFETRFDELTRFANDFSQNEGLKLLLRRGWTGYDILFTRKYYDVAKLERHFSASGKKGGPSLQWTFTVRQDALDEIMDTLQPIGHFGELGYNISGNKVTFEAAGVGCTATVSFEMQDYRLARRHADGHMKVA
jgi:hypothetical protein